MDEVFVRSDNAGCYHCALLMLSIPDISSRTGITTRRYDFSESNSGKDICDRHISPMKGRIRQYVNEGHDVESASDMKKALQSHDGVKSCRIAVVEIDTAKQSLHHHSWTGIQAMSNFEFSETGIRMWKAYSIGPGKLVRYNRLIKNGEKQNDTHLKVIEPFAVPRLSSGSMGSARKAITSRDSGSHETDDSEAFTCPQAGCVEHFVTNTELDKHLDIGKHCYQKQEDSTFDTIKRKWAAACTNVRPSYISGSSDLQEVDYPTEETGWALKKARKTTRFSERVRNHLLKLFIEGEETGNKWDPSVVASRLKTTRALDGTKLFQRSDWLSAQQIRSYFSRLSVIARSGKLTWENREFLQDEEMMNTFAERANTELTIKKVYQAVDMAADTN